MGDAGYQPAWPNDLWPWIRRPTLTSRESGELVDLSWGAPIPSTGWRVYGQRPWHSDRDLDAVAGDPDVPGALASLEQARAALAEEAERVGLADKPTRMGGLLNAVNISGMNHSFAPEVDDILVNVLEVVDGFIHRAVAARIPVESPAFVKEVVGELTQTLTEEIAHTKGGHHLQLDAASGEAFDEIHRLTAAILELPMVESVRDDLELDFRGILTPETLRRWGRLYARLRGEADNGGAGAGGNPARPDD